MQYKLRAIRQSKSKKVYGLTVPVQVSVFFKECFFTVEKSGASIVFTSGTSLIPTKEEIKNFNIEECRV